MVISKQILEAIQKGIKLAVDDFDDLNTIEVQKKARIKDDIHAKDLLPLVDLGLPSRTLWCKYNLGVDPNKLNTAEDWYGGYYAWGEIKTKEYYNWDTYKFSSFTDGFSMIKYPLEIPRRSENLDNLYKLLLEDDAAYIVSNGLYKMPTIFQLKELRDNTEHKWVENYESIKGLNGLIFYKDEKEVFFPAAGYYWDGGLYKLSQCNIWSSSLDYNKDLYGKCLIISKNDCVADEYDRAMGFNIRPVLNR